MKKVYICSPCRGDYENNIQRAKEYSRAAVQKGVIPVTPHIDHGPLSIELDGSVILELADHLISDPGVHIEIGG